MYGLLACWLAHGNCYGRELLWSTANVPYCSIDLILVDIFPLSDKMRYDRRGCSNKFVKETSLKLTF